MFETRVQAGELLADVLVGFKNKSSAIVLGIPRGGVPVAKAIATKLVLPFDVVITKKISSPYQKELAIGSVGPEGKMLLDESLVKQIGVDRKYIEKERIKKIREIKERIKKFRKNKKRVNLKGKSVILTDDGIATGSTVLAAIGYLRNKKVSRVILAVPVAPKDMEKNLKNRVDKLVILRAPRFFHAVGQFYKQFPQLTDKDVIKLLQSK